MMLKTNKSLAFCVLISSVVCIAGDSDSLDELYRISPLLNLPVEYAYSEPYGVSLIDSVKFIKLPESIFPIFKFDDEIYEKDMLYIARLPEYKNIKVIIVKTYVLSGADELFLCTMQNNKLIDKLNIHNSGDAEYDGRTDAISLTSFMITKSYNVLVKHSIMPDRNKEVNVKRWTYIINEVGKIVKK